jgi:hypothetical protein
MKPKDEHRGKDEEWNVMFTFVIEECDQIYCTYNRRIAIDIEDNDEKAKEKREMKVNMMK